MKWMKKKLKDSESTEIVEEDYSEASESKTKNLADFLFIGACFFDLKELKEFLNLDELLPKYKLVAYGKVKKIEYINGEDKNTPSWTGKDRGYPKTVVHFENGSMYLLRYHVNPRIKIDEYCEIWATSEPLTRKSESQGFIAENISNKLTLNDNLILFVITADYDIHSFLIKTYDERKNIDESVNHRNYRSRW